MRYYGQLFLSLTLCFVFAQLTLAQEVWERDWKSWKVADVNKILGNSAWAKNCANSDASLPCDTASRPNLESNHIVTKIPVPVIVRFSSSLKIRQAWLRYTQLLKNYDKMIAKQKAEFHKATENSLFVMFAKNIMSSR